MNADHEYAFTYYYLLQLSFQMWFFLTSIIITNSSNNVDNLQILLVSKWCLSRYLNKLLLYLNQFASVPDPPPGHRMRIFGQLPGCKASLCISLILKWTKICKICWEPKVCQEKWCLWGKGCTNSLLAARSITYPEETISFLYRC